MAQVEQKIGRVTAPLPFIGRRGGRGGIIPRRHRVIHRGETRALRDLHSCGRLLAFLCGVDPSFLRASSVGGGADATPAVECR